MYARGVTCVSRHDPHGSVNGAMLITTGDRTPRDHKKPDQRSAITALAGIG
jgi:hypothetical protein